MLEIVLPFSLVFCTVYVDIHSISIGFIVFPFPFKDISINMVKLPFTASLVVFPFA
jgi:hypothetical protein